MRKLRNAISVMLMVALCASGSAAVAASPTPATQTYRETQMTLPAEYAKNGDWRLASLSAYGDKINLIVEEVGLDGTRTIHHYQSANGGKQWQEKNMDWLQEARKKGDPFLLNHVFVEVAKDDAVYAMVDEGGSVETPTLSYGYFKGNVLKYQNGKAQTLFRLDNRDYNHYEPLGLSLAGGSTLVTTAFAQDLEEYTAKKLQNHVMAFDMLTGKQKSAIPISVKRLPITYTDGRYVMWDADSIVFHDVATGRVLSKMQDLPSDDGITFGEQYAAGSDRALYKMNTKGVFRTEQYTSWEQVLDAGACKRGTAASNYTNCSGLFEAEDGSIYVLLRHEYWNADTETSEFKAATFSRYTPV